MTQPDDQAALAHDAAGRDIARRDMSRTVGAIFYDRAAVDRAVQDLHEHGFGPERIRAAVLRSSDTGVATDDFDAPPQPPGPASEGQKAKTVAGAAAGASLAGAAALVAGIPGIGPLLLGTAAGALLATLTDSGFSDTDARRFEQGLRAGGVLLTVDAGARLSDAVESLIRSGGYVGDRSHPAHDLPATPGNDRFQPG